MGSRRNEVVVCGDYGEHCENGDDCCADSQAEQYVTYSGHFSASPRATRPMHLLASHTLTAHDRRSWLAVEMGVASTQSTGGTEGRTGPARILVAGSLIR